MYIFNGGRLNGTGIVAVIFFFSNNPDNRIATYTNTTVFVPPYFSYVSRMSIGSTSPIPSRLRRFLSGPPHSSTFLDQVLNIMFLTYQ